MTATGVVSESMQAIPKKAFQFIRFGFLGYWIQPFGCKCKNKLQIHLFQDANKNWVVLLFITLSRITEPVSKFYGKLRIQCVLSAFFTFPAVDYRKMDAYIQINRLAKSKESKRSKKPPCPGIICPLSFTPAILFSLLSNKSPKVPVIPAMAAMIPASATEILFVK